MTYDLRNFGLKEMIHTGRMLRQPNPHHCSMEEAAASAVDLFYETFRDPGSPENVRNCVLVRCFATQSLGNLPSLLQQRAKALLPGLHPDSQTQCLVLLATRGECPHWNNRLESAAHQAIPLPTVELVSQAPMIAQLFLQLGLELEQVVHPSRDASSSEETFGVFHVASAPGSGMVPDQLHFVQAFGIQSVLGFGGRLPAGELFAIILFSRVTISPETAALFRTLALGAKLTLLPFSGKQVFTQH